MPKISAVIITLNEEKNIERCLQSLTGVADEIVVVDSFSTDRTAEICQKYGARFIRNKFEGYVEQKNFAVSQAKFPVVLSLDADEALSPLLRESILDVRNNWTHDGYIFNRINNYCGTWIRYTTWYPDRKLRLWLRDKGGWTGMNPHDRVELEKGATTRILKGDMEHYSYYSVSDHISQINNFTTIAARSYYEEGIRSGYMKIIFSPIWKFLMEFIIKKGFMQGYYGLVISCISSFQTFLKYVKLRQLYRKPDNNG
jgi:glycosyltransferase involved in cell wall biosynthesis